MKCQLVTVAYTILLLGGHTLATIIDVESVSIESIADDLCQTSSTARISRVSTISKLYEYFRFSTDSDQASCRDLYLEPLGALKETTEISSDFVCGRKKVEAIENFHWTYIVGSLSKKWRRTSNKILPEPLRLFFIHYAKDIFDQCKRTLSHRLLLAAVGEKAQIDPMVLKKLGGNLKELNYVVIPASKVENYSSFILIWDQITDKERRKGRIVPKEIDEQTGELVIASMRTKDPKAIWNLQSECRHNLRPIYRETVLPVMRLFELGYGFVDVESRNEAERDELLRDWYAVTQICELLVPINFYLDDSMKPGEATVLSNHEQCDGLERSEDVVLVNEVQRDIRIEPSQIDDLLKSASDDKIVKKVKASIESQSHLFRQLFKDMMGNIKDRFSSKLKNIFLLKRRTTDGEYARESGAEFARQSEPEVEEFLKDDEKSSVVLRRKRGLNPFGYITSRRVLSSVGSVILWVCVIVFFLAILGLLVLAGR